MDLQPLARIRLPDSEVLVHRTGPVPVRTAVHATVLDLDDPTGWLVWVLGSGVTPSATALAELLGAHRRSALRGVVGPKLVQATDPHRLRSVGISATRSGRIVPDPPDGMADQGQFDRRADVLAVPVTGALIEAALIRDLRGWERTFGDVGADLDFGWRAQRLGAVSWSTHRPRSGSPTGWAMQPPPPVLVGAPDAGSRSLAQVGGAHRFWPCGCWCPRSPALLACCWRSDLDRRGPLSPMSSLWIPSGWCQLGCGRAEPHRCAAATCRDSSCPPPRSARGWPTRSTRRSCRVVERWRTDPGTEPLQCAQSADQSRPAGHCCRGRRLRGRRPHPRFSLPGRPGGGPVGGELLGGRLTSSALWHAATDPWRGAGLGSATELIGGPHLAVLALPTWVVEHLPGLAGLTSPGAWLSGCCSSPAPSSPRSVRMPRAGSSPWPAGRVPPLLSPGRRSARWRRSTAKVSGRGRCPCAPARGNRRPGPARPSAGHGHRGLGDCSRGRPLGGLCSGRAPARHGGGAPSRPGGAPPPRACVPSCRWWCRECSWGPGRPRCGATLTLAGPGLTSRVDETLEPWQLGLLNSRRIRRSGRSPRSARSLCSRCWGGPVAPACGASPPVPPPRPDRAGCRPDRPQGGSDVGGGGWTRSDRGSVCP